MKLQTLAFTALLAVTATISSSHAATIISDNFDGYTDQAAFEAVWTPIGTVAPLSGVLSTAQASSPTQSVLNPGTATSNQSRNQRTFTESGTLGIGDTLTWSFDYFDVLGTNGPSRNYSNLQDSTAPASANQLISMGLNNNQTGANSGGQYYMARILGYTVPTTADPDGGPAESVGGAGAYFKLNDFTAPHRTTGWHNLKVVMSTNDGVGTDYEFYVDNVLSERVADVGGAATLRSYDVLRIGSGVSNASTDVYFDNMELTIVPEPATAGLVVLVVASLAAIRRRR